MRKNRKSAKVQKPEQVIVAKRFAPLDRLNTEPFMTGGRRQPKIPRRKIF